MPGRLAMRQIAAILAATLAIAACSSTGEPTASTTSSPTTTTTEPQTTIEALTGRWERTGGDFSVLIGMVVDVDEDVTAGTVTFAPRNNYGFKEGDVKWSNLTSVSLDRVRIRDLVRDSDTGLPSYIMGVITLTEDGDMIELDFPSSGTFQVWTRLP